MAKSSQSDYYVLNLFKLIIWFFTLLGEGGFKYLSYMLVN